MDEVRELIADYLNGLLSESELLQALEALEVDPSEVDLELRKAS